MGRTSLRRRSGRRCGKDGSGTRTRDCGGRIGSRGEVGAGGGGGGGEGRIRDATSGLRRSYRLAGKVVSGARRGRTIGFPTANLDEVETLVPGNGVYAAVSEVGGVRYPAAVHIGPNPTFGENAQKIEIHLAGFSGDLYGQTLAIDFLDQVRGVQRFASVDELKIFN